MVDLGKLHAQLVKLGLIDPDTRAVWDDMRDVVHGEQYKAGLTMKQPAFLGDLPDHITDGADLNADPEESPAAEAVTAVATPKQASEPVIEATPAKETTPVTEEVAAPVTEEVPTPVIEEPAPVVEEAPAPVAPVKGRGK